MRVLMLLDSYRQDEVGRFLYRLSQRLTPMPGLVLNSVAFERGPMMDLLSGGAVGVRVLPLAPPRPYRFRPLMNLRRAGRALAQRTDRPDVVHIFCRWPSLRWRMLLGGLDDVPAVWTPPEAHQSPLRRWVGTGLEWLPFTRWRSRHSQQVAALLPSLRDQLPASAGGEAKLLTPGVDAVQTHPLAKVSRARMRILLNVGRDVPLVAVPLHRELTALQEDWIIRLLAQLQGAVPGAVFCVVGPPMEKDSFRSELLDAGVGESARLIGPVPEYLPQVLGAADMAILPLRDDGFHLYAAEAQAAGIPVLTVDSPNNRFFVRHGETGLVVPPGNTGAMCQAFTRLLGDRQELRSMGEAARRLVQEEFEVGNTASALMGLWNSLAPQAAVEDDITRSKADTDNSEADAGRTQALPGTGPQAGS